MLKRSVIDLLSGFSILSCCLCMSFSDNKDQQEQLAYFDGFEAAELESLVEDYKNASFEEQQRLKDPLLKKLHEYPKDALPLDLFVFCVSLERGEL